jgi:N-acetylglucosamine-6-sulfatase
VYDANAFYRKRAETLLAVDEMVFEIVQTLEQGGQLENTFIIFTSDNGFHMGEHNFSGGKELPYTEDVNVPFFVRGPGITPGTTITQLAANIDLAPTFAEIAGTGTADFVDGRSILPLLQAQGALCGGLAHRPADRSRVYEPGLQCADLPQHPYRLVCVYRIL